MAMKLNNASSAIPPTDFICPITQDVMRDPIMCRTGFNFERHSILTWMRLYNNTCPLTRQPIQPRDLVSNHNLRYRIECWCYANGVVLHDPVYGDVYATPTNNETSRPLSDDATILLTFSAAALEEQRRKLNIHPKQSEYHHASTPAPRRKMRPNGLFSRQN